MWDELERKQIEPKTTKSEDLDYVETAAVVSRLCWYTLSKVCKKYYVNSIFKVIEAYGGLIYRFY